MTGTSCPATTNLATSVAVNAAHPLASVTVAVAAVEAVHKRRAEALAVDGVPDGARGTMAGRLQAVTAAALGSGQGGGGGVCARVQPVGRGGARGAAMLRCLDVFVS